MPVVRHWWWLISLLTIVAAVVGYVSASGASLTYESEVRVLVGPYEADLDTIRASSGLVQTYAGLVTADSITTAAASGLGVADLDDVVTSIRANSNEVTRVLNISVTAADPEVAARAANALAAELAKLTSSSPLLQTGTVRVLEAAEPATEAIGSPTLFVTVLAALMGLVAGLALALLLEKRSDVLRDDREIERATGLSVLGTVTPSPVETIDQSTELSRIAGPAGAELRRVVSRLMRAATHEGPVRTLSVVPVSGGGQATDRVVGAMAMALASTGRAVLVLSARRPHSVGIGGEALAFNRIIESPRKEGALPLVPDGKVVTISVDVAGPLRMRPETGAAALEPIAAAASLTMLDLGGFDETVLSHEVASMADSVVFVVPKGTVSRSELVAVVGSFEDVGGPTVAGVVVVARPSRMKKLYRSYLSAVSGNDLVATPAKSGV